MAEKKKIVFKVPEFPHLSETFIVAQIVTAINLGYETQILIRKRTGINPDVCSSLIEEYQLLDKIIIEDYKIPSNRILRFLRWLLILLFNFNNLFYIIKYHKEYPKFSLTWLFQWSFYKKFEDAALFHVQYATNSNPLPILKKAGYRPALIVTFHGHDAFFPINGYIQNNGYYDNLFKYADLITANTPFLGQKILELGCPDEKLKLIPVSVNTDFFYSSKENKNPQNHLQLITVGRLDKVKGQNFCIEAVNRLIQKGINVSLTIIGEGIERKSLETLVKKHQLENCVFLKGSKSREEIRYELWQHDIYLLTGQVTTSGLRETQGLATLEAQACGLPVIVFDSGGVKYTLENGISGFVCDEFDIDAVVSNVIKFIESPILLSKMSAQAIEFVSKKFSQKVIDQKWEMIYNKLSDELQ